MWEEKVYKQNMHLSPMGGLKIACFLKNGVGVLTARRVLPHFTLVYVTRGEGSYWDETGQSLSVTAGDAILISPGVEHWYGPSAGDSWDELYLVFEGPVFNLWRSSGCLDEAGPVMSLRPMDFWRDRILQLIGQKRADTQSELIREVVGLQSLLADIVQARESDMGDDIAWLDQAKSAIAQSLDVRCASARLGYSYEAFRKRFKKLAGQSPGRYRTSVLMERACQMLADPNILLRDISEELGYCDEYHFSRQFSKTVGWAPSEYRSRIAREPARFEELGDLVAGA